MTYARSKPRLQDLSLPSQEKSPPDNEFNREEYRANVKGGGGQKIIKRIDS